MHGRGAPFVRRLADSQIGGLACFGVKGCFNVNQQGGKPTAESPGEADSPTSSARKQRATAKVEPQENHGLPKAAVFCCAPPETTRMHVAKKKVNKCSNETMTTNRR